MKTFQWKTQKGNYLFEIVVDENPVIDVKAGEYWLNIQKLMFNGYEIRGAEIKIIEGNAVISFTSYVQEKNVSEYLKSLLKKDYMKDYIFVQTSDEFNNWHKEIMLKGKELLEKERNEELEKIKNEIPINIKFTEYFTEYSYLPQIRRLINVLNENKEKAKKYLKDFPVERCVDEYDYIPFYIYKISYYDLIEICNKIEEECKLEQQIEEEKRRKEEEERQNELFIWSSNVIYSRAGNEMLHSLGMTVEGDIIEIYTTNMIKYMKGIDYNTTYTIREELKKAGFKYNPETKIWYIKNNPENIEKAINILKQYDTKVDPYELGLQCCWECGQWRHPKELDKNGYCGC